jgi:dipeptidyl aminopeptidase/acylaminoacyl peptidase
MNPEDIAYLSLLGRPSLSADGRFVAYSVATPDVKSDLNRHQIWGGPVDAEAMTRLTDGDTDGSPAVSPDGSAVAFLRPDNQGKSQLHVLSIESGKVTQVTCDDFGAGGPVWAPDSRFVAYTAYCIVDEEKAQRTTVRVTDLAFYSDEVGYTAGLARCIFIADIGGGTVRQITFDDSDDIELSWSPDGKRICFISGKHAGRRNDPREDIWTVSVADSIFEGHTSGGMTLGGPRFSPDGEVIFFFGSELTEQGFTDGYSSFGIWAVPSHGMSAPRRLSEDRYNVSYVCQTIVAHGDRVYMGADWHGRGPLVSFAASGELADGETVIGGDLQVNGFAIAGDAQAPVIAYIAASPESAGELCVYHEGKVRTLTTFGEDLLQHVQLSPANRIEASTSDGHRVEGWVFVPDGVGPHPVVLIVKGGPYTQFGYTMSGPGSFEEARMLCSAGFMVVIGNPRGCAGYGQQHVAGVKEMLPLVTSTDLLALLRRALDLFPGRSDRIGVMGGSFGGSMAVWLVATTDTFLGALAERGCYAMDSLLATSDDGGNIVHALYGDEPSLWHKHSPLTYVDDIKVPVLLLHSDQDRHAPIEQARRVFTEMKMRGKRAELLVFPGGSHELSRSGRPSQRLARWEAVFAWWRELLGN